MTLRPERPLPPPVVGPDVHDDHCGPSTCDRHEASSASRDVSPDGAYAGSPLQRGLREGQVPAALRRASALRPVTAGDLRSGARR